MNLSTELRRLLEEVADICDGGQWCDMKDGADHRYDGNSYGEGLFTAFQNFIHTEEGAKWYNDSVETNHRAVFGNGE